MTMDYSPWSEGEIWPFLKVAISLKPKEAMNIKIDLILTPTCMNFLGQFQSIKFIVHGQKGKFGRF